MKPYCSNAASGWRPARLLGKFLCGGAVAILGTAIAWAQPDYAPAHWTPPSCTKWYTSGYARQFCVIHDIEGYYLSAVSYLNSCAMGTSGNYTVDASVHYLVNGVQNGSGENQPSDPVAGDITQSVRESNYAWHAVCWNQYMFGTEHEGFVSNPAWFTEAMYQASAGLHRHLCDTFGIPKDRNHIIAHGEWQNSAWTTWMAANYPSISTTCNTHTDPGVFWNWSHFMALLTGGNTNVGVYWDRNGSTAGAGATPSGTWDTSSTNWNSKPDGTATPGLWGTQTATFSAGSDATNAYTITVGTTLAINHLLVRQGTVTFTGGQLNFNGFGTYYSNYVAAGAASIFNTPFGGTGSPDKWGPGTAVYNAASTSGGYYTLNEGTLAFGNNSALSTVRLEVGDLTGTKVVTLKSADATAHTLPNYLMLKAATLNFGAGGDLTFSGPINVNSNASPARTIAVSNSVTTFSGVVTNTAGLTKTGPGTLVLSGASANAYGSSSANGYTTVSGGTLKLSKTAGVAAVPNGSLIVNAGGILLLGAANQVGDSIPMTLGGGTFQSAGFSEQLGTLKLTGNSVIDLGGGSSVLGFAASSAVAWTGSTTLTLSNWNGATSGGGTERVVFGSSSSGLSSGQLGQIRFANPPGFPAGTYAAKILGSGEVVPLTVAPGITAQPTNTVAVAGDTVWFAVAATGTPAPAYQWRFNGTNLPNATSATLLLPNVSLSQAGGYSVAVTNVAGATNSTAVLLATYATVAPALNGTLRLANGSFQCGVAGVPGFSYAIWASTNLKDWTPLQTNVSPFMFTNLTADGFLFRFYRAQYVP
jgi:autotransporter-associated beta strand protein